MRIDSPLIMMECEEDYTLLYFTFYSNREPVVRAFFTSVTKDEVKEFFLKDDLTVNEILYYIRHTVVEDAEAEPRDLKQLFNGCKVLSIIP